MSVKPYKQLFVGHIYWNKINIMTMFIAPTSDISLTAGRCRCSRQSVMAPQPDVVRAGQFGRHADNAGEDGEDQEVERRPITCQACRRREFRCHTH